MATPSDLPVELHTAVVLGVTEDACDVVAAGTVTAVGFAPQFPSPRLDRVHPGHLVAVATRPGADPAVVWRWFDAVVLGEDADGGVRLWEPGHGEVVATPRSPERAYAVGSRAYASAGLPGADWWVAGPVVGRPEDADVELAEVDALYRSHDMWPGVFARSHG